LFAQSQLTFIPDAVHVAGSRDGRSSRIRRCRPWMRPWWHRSFGGERRPVEFPHGKSISLPRRTSTRLTPPPHGRSAQSRTKPRNRCPSGAELIVHFANLGGSRFRDPNGRRLYRKERRAVSNASRRRLTSVADRDAG